MRGPVQALLYGGVGGSSRDEPGGPALLASRTRALVSPGPFTRHTSKGVLCWEGLSGPCPVAIHSRMLQNNLRKSWDIFILSGLSSSKSVGFLGLLKKLYARFSPGGVGVSGTVSQTPAQPQGLFGQPGYSLPAPPSTRTPNPLSLSPSLFLPSLIPMPGYWDFSGRGYMGWEGRSSIFLCSFTLSLSQKPFLSVPVLGRTLCTFL